MNPTDKEKQTDPKFRRKKLPLPSSQAGKIPSDSPKVSRKKTVSETNKKTGKLSSLFFSRTKKKHGASSSSASSESHRKRGFVYYLLIQTLWRKGIRPVLLRLILKASLVCVGWIFLFVLWQALTLPPMDLSQTVLRAPIISILDRHSVMLGTSSDGYRKDISLKELPNYVPQALISIEDRRFYQHHGIDPIGLLRAMIRNITSGRIVQGGSTITQQLVKNLFLKPDRTIGRKIQEAILALRMELSYSKETILELYLNHVYFGAGTYGIEEASWHFFEKPAAEISLPEASFLIGLLKAPSRYTEKGDPSLATNRAKLVLRSMLEEGYITSEDYQEALKNPAHIIRVAKIDSSNYVVDWITATLKRLIGDIKTDIYVETTIESGLQLMSESALQSVLDEEGKKGKVDQGAIVLLNPEGAVLAMVGGESYRDSQFNRAIHALRQPGSAFKPFVYLAALEYGLSPDSLRDDTPVRFGKWKPTNYNDRYAGTITLQDSLVISSNIVAIGLAHEVSIGAVMRVARRLGISSPLRRDLSLALGTSEVSLLELTTAFVPFSNGGRGIQPWVVEKVTRKSDGKVLYQHQDSGSSIVILPEQREAMHDMLSAVVHSGTGHRAQLNNMPSAGKTGTTQEYRDAWFIGYTPYMIAGVWVGNDDNSPMNRVTGGTLPALIWQRLMSGAHEGLPAHPSPYGNTDGTSEADPHPTAMDRSGPDKKALFNVLNRIIGR